MPGNTGASYLMVAPYVSNPFKMRPIIIHLAIAGLQQEEVR
jgi:hypothetical protein